MRDFFKALLFQELPLSYSIHKYRDTAFYRGSDGQMHENPNGMRELKRLLDDLERTSKQFIRHIPEEKQKDLILAACKTEKEFYGVDVRFLYKVFSRYLESRAAMLNSQYHKQETETDLKNAEEAKKRLEEKRKEDPDYDPIEIMKRRIDKAQTKTSAGVGRFQQKFGESIIAKMAKTKKNE